MYEGGYRRFGLVRLKILNFKLFLSSKITISRKLIDRRDFAQVLPLQL